MDTFLTHSQIQRETPRGYQESIYWIKMSLNNPKKQYSQTQVSQNDLVTNDQKEGIYGTKIAVDKPKNIKYDRLLIFE